MRTSCLLVLGLCLVAGLTCAHARIAGIGSPKPTWNYQEIFSSLSWQDGWLLKPAEAGSSGNLDASGVDLRVGDDSADRQVQSILSFRTGTLPDDAVITAVSLVLKQQGEIIGSGDPFTVFRGLLIDIKWGCFGAPELEVDDFGAMAHISSFGPYQPGHSEGYTFSMREVAYPYINKWPFDGGLTQFRLHFKLETNRNGRADYIRFSSGDEPTASLRPQLFIEYHLPTRMKIGQAPRVREAGIA